MTKDFRKGKNFIRDVYDAKFLRVRKHFTDFIGATTELFSCSSTVQYYFLLILLLKINTSTSTSTTISIVGLHRLISDFCFCKFKPLKVDIHLIPLPSELAGTI